jgi:hypothetical protein
VGSVQLHLPQAALAFLVSNYVAVLGILKVNNMSRSLTPVSNHDMVSGWQEHLIIL